MSEAAGLNSAAGSFGLSFGLAFAGAIMLAALSVSFLSAAQTSTVLSPSDQQRVARALEDNAELMGNAQLAELLYRRAPCGPGGDSADQHRRPTAALQVALLIPLVASVWASRDSFRMLRLPDPEPTGAGGVVLGD